MGVSSCNPFSLFAKSDNARAPARVDAATEERSSVAAAGGGEEDFVQNVVVMRHGDRLDSAQPMWAAGAKRPWDPPLTDGGKVRAWTTGKKLRSIGFPIHRVVVSPFLRCLQTAAEVVSALCAVVVDGAGGDGVLLGMATSDGVVIDPSRVKVSIEYGLCEVLCGQTIHPNHAPKKGKWFPNPSELEAVLPAGTIDHSVKSVYKKLPSWEESLEDARSRYEKVILALGDKFPRQNLLLVTHGEGVGVSVSAFFKDMHVYDVEFCGYSHLQRQISSSSSQVRRAESFKALTPNGQTGVSYSTLD